jgi:NADPH2:quinone reductase
VLDYGRADLAEAVTAVGEPNVILDHRLDDYLQFDADVAAKNARVVGIGGNSPESGFSNTPAARSKELRVHLMSMFNTPDFRAVLDRLATLMAEGDLTAETAGSYDLAEVGEAHRAVVEDSVCGKLVVEP